MATLPYTINSKETRARHITIKIEVMKRWCLDNIGERYDVVSRDGVWAVLWSTEVRDFRWHFKHEKDLLFFKLKWA